MTIQYVTNRQWILDQLLNARPILAADDGYILFANNSIYHLSLETMRSIHPLLEMMSAPYPTIFQLSEVGIRILKEQHFWLSHAKLPRHFDDEATLTETYRYIRTLKPGRLVCWRTDSGKWLSSVTLHKLADLGLIDYVPPPNRDMFLSGQFFIR